MLDVCQVLAGPTGGRLLYEFGADVIKIYGPHSRIGEHGYLNRGKRSILLDVKSRAGQQVFWKLLERSDIVLQNFPPGHGGALRHWLQPGPRPQSGRHLCLGELLWPRPLGSVARL